MKLLLLITLLGLNALASSVTYAICNANIIKNKPDNLYTDNANGTVTDTKTKLMWQKCSYGQAYKGASCSGTATYFYYWGQALSTANTNTQYGYSDWRVPNKNELASLVEGACYSPSINTSLFPATQSNSYWSSSPYAEPYFSWKVDFDLGYVEYNRKSYGSYVRLVRGGY